MSTIEDYFTHACWRIQGVFEGHPECYEEHILPPRTRGNLRIRLRFSDQALGEISEAVLLMARELR